jgi:hypothetical protein
MTAVPNVTGEGDAPMLCYGFVIFLLVFCVGAILGVGVSIVGVKCGVISANM